MGSATKPGSQKGSRGNAPCRVQGRRPCWGLGQRPNCSSSNLLKGRSQQGAGSEASLPLTSRVLRRAPKPLYTTTVLCRAKWARPSCWSCDHSRSFPNAGISPLRRRVGGFAVAPDTPSQRTPMLLNFYLGFLLMTLLFPEHRNFKTARRFFAHAPACSCASVSITASEAFG